MRLTLMTDYALRLLIHVGQHPDRLCTIAEVAGAYGISEAHLMKITHQLGQAGFIETVRGKGGGMRLAAPPAKIGLGTVVRRLEPDFALVECLAADNRCVLTGRCRLAGILSDGLDGFLSHLGRYTLADLLPDAVPVPAAASKTGTKPRAKGAAGPGLEVRTLSGAKPATNAATKAAMKSATKAAGRGSGAKRSAPSLAPGLATIRIVRRTDR